MKIVDTETVIKWRRHNPRVRRVAFHEVSDNYVPSLKVSRSSTMGNKKKLLNVHHVLDESLGLRFQDNETQTIEAIQKGVTMALNKLSTDNAKKILEELKSIKIHDEVQQTKLAFQFTRKIFNESAFRTFYLDAIENVPWTIISDDYICSFLDRFVMELQQNFENIKNLTKDEAIPLMETLALIYPRKWIDNEVFDQIISYLLQQPGNTYIEYIITFLKDCNSYHNREATIDNLLNRVSLPMRLKLLLKTI